MPDLSADPFDLARFVDEQASGVWEQAIGELRAGRKRSHWMWFVLPQGAGLGTSRMSQEYAVSGLDEAKAYLTHPVLGERLRECCRVLLDLDPNLTAQAIFGDVDAVKLRSCVSLFAAADQNGALFGEVLDRFFCGIPDPRAVPFQDC